MLIYLDFGTNKKMLSCLLFLAMFIVIARTDPSICTQDGELMNCICNANENAVLAIESKFSVTDMVVKGCGRIELYMSGLLSRRFNRIEFIDIDSLSIGSFVLHGVEVMSHVLLSNISNLVVRENSFYGLKNVGALILHRVHAIRLQKSAFSGMRNISNLEISECNIGNIEPYAFAVNNVTYFKVENSYLGYLNRYSFVIDTAEKVSFFNTSINMASKESIVVNDTKVFLFEQCLFGTIDSYAFHPMEISNFVFANCSVKKLASDAFGQVYASESVVFERNNFQIAENNSLLSEFDVHPVSSNDSIRISENRFTCNCNISWMWGWSYTSIQFLETSYCINSNARLTSLSLIVDEEGTCLKLDEVDDHSSPVSSSTSNFAMFGLTFLFVSLVCRQSLCVDI